VHLATHLDHVGPAGAGEARGDVGEGPQVLGHVLAGAAVAAGGALNEHAPLVAEGGGEAVDLGFGVEGQGLRLVQAQEAADPGRELGDVRLGEGVVQRQHGHAMCDRRELGGRRRADSGRRGVRADEVGVGGLQLGVAPA
jgi:hypothetical protein